MAVTRKSTNRIKDEIAKLKEQLRQAETREAERLGALAVKAGLHEVDASEAAILEALSEIGARFRNKPKASGQAD